MRDLVSTRTTAQQVPGRARWPKTFGWSPLSSADETALAPPSHYSATCRVGRRMRKENLGCLAGGMTASRSGSFRLGCAVHPREHPTHAGGAIAIVDEDLHVRIAWRGHPSQPESFHQPLDRSNIVRGGNGRS